MRIGNTVTCRREVLSNKPGAKGVVYEEYDLGWGPGVSVIFENGHYDGFSPDEQENFLMLIGHEPQVEDYQFKNVLQLEKDFREGYFKPVFGNVTRTGY